MELREAGRGHVEGDTTQGGANYGGICLDMITLGRDRGSNQTPVSAGVRWHEGTLTKAWRRSSLRPVEEFYATAAVGAEQHAAACIKVLEDGAHKGAGYFGGGVGYFASKGAGG